MNECGQFSTQSPNDESPIKMQHFAEGTVCYTQMHGQVVESNVRVGMAHCAKRMVMRMESLTVN